MQTTAIRTQARCTPSSTRALILGIAVTIAVSALLLVRSPTTLRTLILAAPASPTRKDLFFTPTVPTHCVNASHPHSPPCVIFSCSSPGYFLVGPHLRFHTARRCDRIHFTGYTTDETGKDISPFWCRVALLRDMDHLFQPYQKVIYTDLDIVYSEDGFLAQRCGTGLKSVILSMKIYDGITQVLRTPWIVFCDRKDRDMLRLVQKWARKHREVDLMDQTVFNENWDCDQVNCVPGEMWNKTELRHCASWRPKKERLKCFEMP